MLFGGPSPLPPLERLNVPLFHLHIPKTGGTSLVEQLARRFPPDRQLLPRGSITAQLLEQNRDRLNGPLLIGGHPTRAVLHALPLNSAVITLVRSPREQMISHYLHMRRSPRNPWRDHAHRLGLADLLRAYPDLAQFQSICLLDALRAETDTGSDQILDRLDDIFAMLEACYFVGVLERIDESCAVLAAKLGASGGLRLKKRNRAARYFRPLGRARRNRLRAEYDGLRADPVVGPRIATEERLYAKALSLLDRARAQTPGP